MNRAPEPRLLIDGYNLLFHGGLEGTSRSPGWLQAARMRLVGLLERKLSDAVCRRTQIVFDASEVRSKTQADFVSGKGIRVVFARSHPEADDLIEQIIGAHSHPKQLEVVSSDNRLRTRASRRKAVSTPSEEFLDAVEDLPDALPKVDTSSELADSTANAKGTLTGRVSDLPSAPEIPSNEELERFLRELGADEI